MILNKIFILIITATVLWFANSCNSIHEENVDDKNIRDVTEFDSIKVQNFIEANGYFIFTGNSNYLVIQDSLDIKKLPKFDAVSYCGQYGYSMDGENEDNLSLSVIEIATGNLIRTKLLKDIIDNSKHSYFLNESYENTFNDTFGWLGGRTGSYYFDYNIRNIFISTEGIIIKSYWYGGDPRARYRGLYLFINQNLKLTRFAPVSYIGLSPDFIIDNGDSITFTYGPSLYGTYYFNNPMYRVIEKEDQHLFDFTNLETFEISANSLRANDKGTQSRYLKQWYNELPNVVINRKRIYILAAERSSTPVLIVYNPYNNRVVIFNTPTLSILHDDSEHFLVERLSIQGLSDEYIFFRRSFRERYLYFHDSSEKPAIYAIPRKILDYAN